MNKHKMKLISLTTILTLGLYVLVACNSNSENSLNTKNLVIKQQCKPLKNQCSIFVGDNEIQLLFKAPPSYQRLLPISLTSETSLNDVSLTLIIDDEEMPLVKMKKSKDKNRWEASVLPFASVSPDNLKIRLLVTYKEALYSAEFPIVY